MRKRLRKKLQKLRFPWSPLIKMEVAKLVIPLAEDNTTPEQTETSPSSGDLAFFEVPQNDIKELAESLTKWIESSGFVKPLEDYLSFSHKTASRTLFSDVDSRQPDRPIWFIGDLHGDISALKILTAFAQSHDKHNGITKPTRLFFLGDYTDDAPFSAEIVAWLMKHSAPDAESFSNDPTAEHREGFQIMTVIGNHDDGLKFIDDDSGGRFASTVSPSTFADELNDRMRGPHSVAWKTFGQAAIAFFNAMPRMVMLGKTVMVAHGGVPHSDILITKREDLDSAQALSDFVWNRLHETAPKKFPNRESRGSQLGIRDFEAFIAKFAGADIGGVTPRIFIRGHDHHEDNFKLYGNFKGCSVLTLNAFTVNRGTFGKKFRDLALLRWVPSEPGMMTLFQLKFQNGALEKIWNAIAPKNGTFIQEVVNP